MAARTAGASTVKSALTATDGDPLSNDSVITPPSIERYGGSAEPDGGIGMDNDRDVSSVGDWEAQVLVAGTGPWHEPVYPEIPGLGEFEGAVFHSSRWDHDRDLRGPVVDRARSLT